jgi:hypothetical protein
MIVVYINAEPPTDTTDLRYAAEALLAMAADAATEEPAPHEVPYCYTDRGSDSDRATETPDNLRGAGRHTSGVPP